MLATTINYKKLVIAITEIRDAYFKEYYCHFLLKSDSSIYAQNINNIASNNSTVHKKTLVAFNALSAIDQRFINNEFFYQDYSNWWVPYYSKSTFYRLKRRAMEEFLLNYEKN